MVVFILFTLVLLTALVNTTGNLLEIPLLLLQVQQPKNWLRDKSRFCLYHHLDLTLKSRPFPIGGLFIGEIKMKW